MYYQLDEIVTIKDSVGEFTLNEQDKGQSVVSFHATGLMRMGYFAYYPSEAGLGAHQHDLEAAEFKIASENHPAWLHTLSITAAFSEGDGLCRIWAGLHDIDGGLGTGKSEQLIQAHATALSPANVAITLPTPIKIDPLDEMYVRGSVLNGAGECRVEAYFGVRVPPAEDD